MCRVLLPAFLCFPLGLIFLPENGSAALVTNGSAIGTDYTIQGIDGGIVSVDFAAHDPLAGLDGNSQTIGKLTVTMNHAGLNWLGFSLKQNAAPVESSGATGGLRLLLDVKDTNAMSVAWTDYHIRAIDSITNDQFNQINPAPMQGGHLVAAHFHDTVNTSQFVFGSTPLVLEGNGDNVIQLNFGLGQPVNPTTMFQANNILLHERSFANIQREFRVEFIPSVPEPGSLAIFLGFGIATTCIARRRRRQNL